jgi:hypothetical protein
VCALYDCEYACRNLYNEWVLCLKKTDNNNKVCLPARRQVNSICPDEWVSWATNYCILMLTRRLSLYACLLNYKIASHAETLYIFICVHTDHSVDIWCGTFCSRLLPILAPFKAELTSATHACLSFDAIQLDKWDEERDEGNTFTGKEIMISLFRTCYLDTLWSCIALSKHYYFSKGVLGTFLSSEMSSVRWTANAF